MITRGEQPPGRMPAGLRWFPGGAVAGLAGFLLLLLLFRCAAGAVAAPVDELGGRYVIAKDLDATMAAEPYAGIVDIKVRRTVCTLNWRIRGQSTRRLQALGLRDKPDSGALTAAGPRGAAAAPLVCASMNTGGAAYGMSLYRRVGAGRWKGTWITSVDDGSELGEMTITTDPAATTLVGRHRLAGSRGRAGSFAGAVTVTAQGEFYDLAYEVNGISVYRGLGVIVPGPDGRDDRLAVAWSYGSKPALAIYTLEPDGTLVGRRVSLHLGEPQIRPERLARNVAGTDSKTGQLLLPPPVEVDEEAGTTMPGP